MENSGDGCAGARRRPKPEAERSPRGHARPLEKRVGKKDHEIVVEACARPGGRARRFDSR